MTVADERQVPCEECGGEGRIYRRCRVYEPGCGFSHDGEEDCGWCSVCHGGGYVFVETQPVDEADFAKRHA